MDAIFELWKAFGVQIIALVLTLPRVYAFLDASQIFNSSAVPTLPRSAAILALALVAVPINLEYAGEFVPSAPSFALFFAKEFTIGFIAGYLVSMIFWVVQAAGGLMDNQRGAAIAASIDPLQGEEASLLGNLFSQAFLTYLFTAGAFLPVLGILYRSFVLWPATKAVPVMSDAFPAMMLGMFDNAMRLAFVLAAPIVAIMFIAEFALALVSRFSPQIQVFVLAMPIKSILAIIVLIFYFGSLLPFAAQKTVAVSGAVDQLFEMMRASESSGSRPPVAGERRPPR